MNEGANYKVSVQKLEPFGEAIKVAAERVEIASKAMKSAQEILVRLKIIGEALNQESAEEVLKEVTQKVQEVQTISKEANAELTNVHNLNGLLWKDLKMLESHNEEKEERLAAETKENEAKAVQMEALNEVAQEAVKVAKSAKDNAKQASELETGIANDSGLKEINAAAKISAEHRKGALASALLELEKPDSAYKGQKAVLQVFIEKASIMEKWTACVEEKIRELKEHANTAAAQTVVEAGTAQAAAKAGNQKETESAVQRAKALAYVAHTAFIAVIALKGAYLVKEYAELEASRVDGLTKEAAEIAGRAVETSEVKAAEANLKEAKELSTAAGIIASSADPEVGKILAAVEAATKAAELGDYQAAYEAAVKADNAADKVHKAVLKAAVEVGYVLDENDEEFQLHNQRESLKSQVFSRNEKDLEEKEGNFESERFDPGKFHQAIPAERKQFAAKLVSRVQELQGKIGQFVLTPQAEEEGRLLSDYLASAEGSVISFLPSTPEDKLKVMDLMVGIFTRLFEEKPEFSSYLYEKLRVGGDSEKMEVNKILLSIYETACFIFTAYPLDDRKESKRLFRVCIGISAGNWFLKNVKKNSRKRFYCVGG